MNTKFAIELRHVSKAFNGNVIIRNIDLQIKKGEILGFLGRNGAGKSTLMNTFTGVNKLTSGEYYILGAESKKIDTQKKYIGVMPDTSNLYQHMDAYSFMKYMGELKGVKLSKKEIDRLLKLVDLNNTQKKKIKKFSFGMKKKISIAQALIGDPKIIILDEPTSGVDPESSIHIQNVIQNLNKSGVTVFITSHNMSEIEKICDRIAIISGGEIKNIGTLQQLKQTYNPKIRISIESNPILTSEFIKKMEIDYANISNDIENKNVVVNVNTYDNIPDLLNILVKNDYKIYNFRQEEVSLEKIFLST